MPARPSRYRLMVWYDETGGALQGALAHYVDDVKQTEDTWTCGPFDTVTDTVATAQRTIARRGYQLVLPFS